MRRAALAGAASHGDSAPSVDFFRQVSAELGIGLIDPVADGYRDRWVTKCGGTLSSNSTAISRRAGIWPRPER